MDSTNLNQANDVHILKKSDETRGCVVFP